MYDVQPYRAPILLIALSVLLGIGPCDPGPDDVPRPDLADLPPKPEDRADLAGAGDAALACTPSAWKVRYQGQNDQGWATISGLAVDPMDRVTVHGNFGGWLNWGPGPLDGSDRRAVFAVQYSAAGSPILPAVTYGGPLTELRSAQGIAGELVLSGMILGGEQIHVGEKFITAMNTETVLVQYRTSSTLRWYKQYAKFMLPGASLRILKVHGSADQVTLSGQARGSIVLDEKSLVMGNNHFILRYDQEGRPLWLRLIGPIDSADLWDFAVDGSGAVTAIGEYRGTIDLGGGPMTATGTSDAFVVRYGNDGSFKWARSSSGLAGHSAMATVVSEDQAGDLILTGMFEGTVDFGGGALASLGNKDIFVARLDSSGKLRWARRFGGTAFDGASGTRVGRNGDLVLLANNGPADLGGGPVASGRHLVWLTPGGDYRAARSIDTLFAVAPRNFVVDSCGQAIVASSSGDTYPPTGRRGVVEKIPRP